MLNKAKLATVICLGILLSGSAASADDKSSKVEISRDAGGKIDAKGEKNTQIDMDKLSEAFGNFIGRNLQSPGLKFNIDSLINGIREGAAGKPSPLTEKEYEEMMAAVQERAFKEMSETNLKSANEFMSKNIKEPGVKEIVPGQLQYSTLKEGTGTEVTAHASPKIHYTGKYQDGTVFGTSEEMGGPITIPLDQTIPGFSKGIVGMKEGEKRRLFVHPDLGYGTTGQLPPNELLIFDIEVVKANANDEKAKDASKDSSKSQSSDSDDDDFYFDEEDFTIETPAATKAK
jgi:peptidylprolyl isomerase